MPRRMRADLQVRPSPVNRDRCRPTTPVPFSWLGWDMVAFVLPARPSASQVVADEAKGSPDGVTGPTTIAEHTVGCVEAKTDPLGPLTMPSDTQPSVVQVTPFRLCSG